MGSVKMYVFCLVRWLLRYFNISAWAKGPQCEKKKLDIGADDTRCRLYNAQTQTQTRTHNSGTCFWRVVKQRRKSVVNNFSAVRYGRTVFFLSCLWFICCVIFILFPFFSGAMNYCVCRRRGRQGQQIWFFLLDFRFIVKKKTKWKRLGHAMTWFLMSDTGAFSSFLGMFFSFFFFFCCTFWRSFCHRARLYHAAARSMCNQARLMFPFHYKVYIVCTLCCVSM